MSLNSEKTLLIESEVVKDFLHTINSTKKCGDRGEERKNTQPCVVAQIYFLYATATNNTLQNVQLQKIF
jgi:hypothetical protein